MKNSRLHSVMMAMCLLICFAMRADAADGNLLWALSMGGTGEDRGENIASDSDGNIIVAGYFNNTADFDPSVGTYELTSAGSKDIFIAKYAGEGNLVWARAMGGTEEDHSYDVAVDGNNNIYITGYFLGTVDFDPGPGTYELSALNHHDIFIVKLDSNGDLLWAKSLPGTGVDVGTSITAATTGDIYVTGYFSGTTDFDAGPSLYELTSRGDYDIFVLKMDSDGNFVWAGQMGGTGWERGIDIALDSDGNVYTTGYFNGTADFNPGLDTFELTPSHSFDIFVSKLDSNGNFIWAKAMGGIGEDQGYALAVDSNNNVYITGFFEAKSDFDPGPGSVELTSEGYGDIYVVKLDSAGAFLWVKQMGGANWERGISIVCDSAGNVYTTGYFEGTTNFNLGGDPYELTSSGVYDVFITKHDGDGSHAWTKSMGGVNSVSVGSGIALDSYENICITGQFNDSVDVVPSEQEFTLNSTGLIDGFVVKLSYDTTSPNVIAITPNNAGPTNVDSIEFTVVFDEPIQGFNDETDVIINHNGTSHTGVTIAGTDDIYVVTVMNITGDGTLTLGINTSGNIQDAAGNLLVSTITSEPVIIDNTPPTIAISPPSVTETVDGPVIYTVTYSGEEMVYLSEYDVAIVTSDTVTASVTVSAESESEWIVTVHNISGTGSFGIYIAAGTAIDAAGNLAPSATSTVSVLVVAAMPLSIWWLFIVLAIAATVTVLGLYLPRSLYSER